MHVCNPKTQRVDSVRAAPFKTEGIKCVNVCIFNYKDADQRSSQQQKGCGCSSLGRHQETENLVRRDICPCSCKYALCHSLPSEYILDLEHRFTILLK